MTRVDAGDGAALKVGNRAGEEEKVPRKTKRHLKQVTDFQGIDDWKA